MADDLDVGSSEETAIMDQNVESSHENVTTTNFNWMKFFRDSIIQILLMYFVMNYFFKKSPSKSGTSSPEVVITAKNLYKGGDSFNLFVFLSENKYMDSEKSILIWELKDLKYNVWKQDTLKNGYVTKTHNFLTSKNLVNNGSLYITSCVTLNNVSPTFSPSVGYFKDGQSCYSKELTKMKKVLKNTKKNLISGSQNVEIYDDFIASHWHSNISINAIFDEGSVNPYQIVPMISEYIRFNNEKTHYYPVLYINDFWNLNSDYKPITEKNESLELHITFQPIGMLKWQFYLGQSNSNPFKIPMLESNEDDKDKIKETILNTNLYLLALTFGISIVHSIFELLAFKNDIQFWRTRENLEGLSVNSILFGIFQSVVVLLYVLDNDTNVMVIVSCGIGVLIDSWKITKVINISLNWNSMIAPFPSISFSNKSTYVTSGTKEYDKMAIKYLSIGLLPVFLSYCAYSLIYNEHSGWYSFSLGVLYGFLLTFGFIMMTPQLFINYKLKSVAHLPWRMLTYKALNTFIDDIFAFVIKMPTLYRLGCFRDDIVFFIYLYQKWIYPVDHKRVNEFGTTGEQSISDVNKKD